MFLRDVILGVNGDSFTDMGHHVEVKYLSNFEISFQNFLTFTTPIDPKTFRTDIK